MRGKEEKSIKEKSEGREKKVGQESAKQIEISTERNQEISKQFKNIFID
jgi:hypothetical protein